MVFYMSQIKHLLTILIFFSLTLISFAEETYLGCWEDGSDELVYEIDINFEQYKLWINDYQNEIVLVTEKHIVANGPNGTVRTTINRFTGELTESLNKTDGTAAEIFKRLNCKRLEQLF